MTWGCGCGVVNRDSKVKCMACRTPKGMVWTPTESDVSRSLSKDYQSALKVALLLQIIIGLFAAIAIDGGLTFDVWWRSMAVYYGCLVVMLFRRPNAPTKVDLWMIRYGFAPLFFPITPMLTVLIAKQVWM